MLHINNIYSTYKNLKPGVDAPFSFEVGYLLCFSVAANNMGVSPRHLSKIDLSNLKQNREAVEIIPSMLQPPFCISDLKSAGNA